MALMLTNSANRLAKGGKQAANASKQQPQFTILQEGCERGLRRKLHLLSAELQNP